ncbi:unnamed protein product, partial [marine sediment metagenome]
MRLLVPANWDRELILPLSQIKADIQIYGVLPTSMLGSGGSGPDIPQITTKQAEEYIELAHSAGLTFNYLLNAPCMNNMEWQEDTHRELVQHLEWVNNYFGVIKAGGVAVLLSSRLKAPELDSFLRDSDTRILITEKKFSQMLSAVLPSLPQLKQVLEVDGGSYKTMVAGSSAVPPDVDIDDEDKA